MYSESSMVKTSVFKSGRSGAGVPDDGQQAKCGTHHHGSTLRLDSLRRLNDRHIKVSAKGERLVGGGERFGGGCGGGGGSRLIGHQRRIDRLANLLPKEVVKLGGGQSSFLVVLNGKASVVNAQLVLLQPGRTAADRLRHLLNVGKLLVQVGLGRLHGHIEVHPVEVVLQGNVALKAGRVHHQRRLDALRRRAALVEDVLRHVGQVDAVDGGAGHTGRLGRAKAKLPGNVLVAGQRQQTGGRQVVQPVDATVRRQVQRRLEDHRPGHLLLADRVEDRPVNGGQVEGVHLPVHVNVLVEVDTLKGLHPGHRLIDQAVQADHLAEEVHPVDRSAKGHLTGGQGDVLRRNVDGVSLKVRQRHAVQHLNAHIAGQLANLHRLDVPRKGLAGVDHLPLARPRHDNLAQVLLCVAVDVPQHVQVVGKVRGAVEDQSIEALSATLPPLPPPPLAISTVSRLRGMPSTRPWTATTSATSTGERKFTEPSTSPRSFTFSMLASSRARSRPFRAVFTRTSPLVTTRPEKPFRGHSIQQVGPHVGVQVKATAKDGPPVDGHHIGVIAVHRLLVELADVDVIVGARHQAAIGQHQIVVQHQPLADNVVAVQRHRLLSNLLHVDAGNEATSTAQLHKGLHPLEVHPPGDRLRATLREVVPHPVGKVSAVDDLRVDVHRRAVAAVEAGSGGGVQKAWHSQPDNLLAGQRAKVGAVQQPGQLQI
ncbi:hypothetical protein TYRP_002638 [Tyrophagus putrescentiae]|nr:hypothetical protein TYRP_002638 [Tyrophagus putrescentiae]